MQMRKPSPGWAATICFSLRLGALVLMWVYGLAKSKLVSGAGDRPKQILGATRIWEESREDRKLDAGILTQRILTQRCSGSRANGRSLHKSLWI